MRSLALRFVASLLAFIILCPTVEAVYRLGKRRGPADVLTEADLGERREALRSGHLFAEGGYSADGVWAKMEAVIDAPPRLVWRLFIQSNDWKDYGIPFLFDNRAISPDIVAQAQSLTEVTEFYSLLGNQVFNPTENRHVGGKWESYVFQFVNVKWPLKDRWVINRNRHDETRSKQGLYRVSWTKQGGDVKRNDGTMILQPFDGNPDKTRLVYIVDVHPGAWVPRFLMKNVVTKSMPDAIKAIRRAAAKAQGRPLWPPASS